jgi:hypothetical protein
MMWMFCDLLSTGSRIFKFINDLNKQHHETNYFYFLCAYMRFGSFHENLRQPVQHSGLLNRLYYTGKIKYITTGKEENIIYVKHLPNNLLIHLKLFFMKQKLFFLIILLFMIVAAGCSKDKDKEIEEIEVVEVPVDPEPPSDPESSRYPGVNVGDFYKSFIGKWQQIDCGTYWPDSISKLHVKPDGHILEFFEDSTAQRSSNKYKIINCRTDAEFLYYTVEEELRYTYRYTFNGPDTLRLDYEQGLIALSMGTVISNTYKRHK